MIGNPIDTALDNDGRKREENEERHGSTDKTV